MRPDEQTPEGLARVDRELAKWRTETSAAAGRFESRWTMLVLRRVDAGIAQRLHEQRGLFDQACVIGDAGQIAVQGRGLAKGYAVAVATLEEAGAEDDAYQLGRCPTTGTVVAIGEQRAAVERVREIHGEAVVWVTPDEVATLFASVEGFKAVAAVKKRFPGAEIIDRHLHEGT